MSTISLHFAKPLFAAVEKCGKSNPHGDNHQSFGCFLLPESALTLTAHVDRNKTDLPGGVTCIKRHRAAARGLLHTRGLRRRLWLAALWTLWTLWTL